MQIEYLASHSQNPSKKRRMMKVTLLRSSINTEIVQEVNFKFSSLEESVKRAKSVSESCPLSSSKEKNHPLVVDIGDD